MCADLQPSYIGKDSHVHTDSDRRLDALLGDVTGIKFKRDSSSNYHTLSTAKAQSPQWGAKASFDRKRLNRHPLSDIVKIKSSCF